jgi:hypothetical protein
MGMEWIRPSEDGTHFVGRESGRRFTVWGVNYDRDESGRLIEDYWDREWPVIEADFGEIKGLGANLVRIHLQLGKFMESPDRPNERNLALLGKLVKLAEETQLYLDVTGLGCYHRKDVPVWYDRLPEHERWEVQARFWKEFAKVCRDSPAVFCYDLMNEPVLPGSKVENEWLTGELDGKFYIQRIALDLRGRESEDVARQWVSMLAAAIREVDARHMITVGVVPWALEFEGAKPIFYAPRVHGPLDFASVHFYPKKGEVQRALAALKVYDIGKPLLVEEIFPINGPLEEVDAFVEGSRGFCDGWVGFYWGKPIEENEKQGDMKGAVTAAWLRYFRSQASKAGWEKEH